MICYRAFVISALAQVCPLLSAVLVVLITQSLAVEKGLYYTAPPASGAME